MSSNSIYIQNLIEQAKLGRKSQFIELSLEFLPRTYSIVFGLVPNIEAAKKVCTEVFYIIWKRIETIKSDTDFTLQLREIAIVRSFLYLQNVEEIELDGLAIQKITKGESEFFTKIEREFLKLTYIQRVILVLNDKLELPNIRIAEVLKTLSQEEIMEELHSAREILLKEFPDGKLEEFPEHGWAILNDCLMKLDKGIDQYLEDEVVEFISEYLQQSKDLLDGIFNKITPDDEIVVYLKDYLLRESANQKTKKDLAAFSNSYRSVSAKSKDVLFEKAFIKPKTTMSDIKEVLTVITPTKKTRSRLPYFLGFIGIVLLAYFLLNSGKNVWLPQKAEGSFKIGENLSRDSELSENTNIFTKRNSIVEIENNNSSSIIIQANSNLILDELESDFTKFSLLAGDISIINKKTKSFEKRLIKIKVNDVGIISNRGKLDISFSKENGLEVNVESGFSEVQLDKVTYCLVKNYQFIKTNNNKHLIPFRKNATHKFIKLIKSVNPQNVDKLAILNIIKSSSKKDYLTLYNLILISDKPSRKLLLDKLNTFFPLKTLFVWNKLVDLEKNEIEFFKNFLVENSF